MNESWIAKSYLKVGEFFGVKTETISAWATKHGMPKIRKGRYDLSAIAQWRESYLRDEVGLLDGADTPALERYRELRCQLAELELKEKKGELVPREEVEVFAVEVSQAISASVKRLEKKSKKAAEALAAEILSLQATLDKKWKKETR